MAKTDGGKVSITINAADYTKYRVDETQRKRFPEPMFEVRHLVNTAEVEKFKERNGRLPDHVYEVGVDDGEN